MTYVPERVHTLRWSVCKTVGLFCFLHTYTRCGRSPVLRSVWVWHCWGPVEVRLCTTCSSTQPRSPQPHTSESDCLSWRSLSMRSPGSALPEDELKRHSNYEMFIRAQCLPINTLKSGVITWLKILWFIWHLYVCNCACVSVCECVFRRACVQEKAKLWKSNMVDLMGYWGKDMFCGLRYAWGYNAHDSRANRDRNTIAEILSVISLNTQFYELF